MRQVVVLTESRERCGIVEVCCGGMEGEAGESDQLAKLLDTGL